MYFGNEYLQDVIYEQTVLNEMHISKEDLKDPKILEKVLEKSKKEQNTKASIAMGAPMVLGIAADVVAGIATGSIVTSLALFIPFIIGSIVLAAKILDKIVTSGDTTENKNIAKLIKKVQNLRSKTEKLKDSKEKTEILENCDKILKSVDKYKVKKADKAEKERVGKIKNRVKMLIDASKGKSFIIDPDIETTYENYLLADKLGISSASALDKTTVDICMKDNIKKEGILDLFYSVDDIDKVDNYHEKDVDKLDKMIKGFKQNVKVIAFYAIDDTIFFFNPSNKKFYYGSYDSDSLYGDSSLYNLCKKCGSKLAKKFTDQEITEYKQIYEEMKNEK